MGLVNAETRREILRLAVPVGLESVFLLALGLINQIIVGSLGTAVIAGVGLANNLMFMGQLSLGTLGSGSSILVSRAYGRSDQPAVQRIVTFTLVFAIGVALAVGLPLSLWATALLQAVGADPEVALAGGPYLKLMALSLPLTTASVLASAAFRALGKPRIPMVLTMSTLLLSPLLSYLLIFPLELGVVGAAWATLIAQGLRTTLLAILLFSHKYGVRWSWPQWSQARLLLGEMAHLGVPLFLTELVFSGGIFLYALLFERLGTEPLAAFQIASALETVFITANFGFHTAGTILVARAIGKRDTRQVWHLGGSVWQLGLMCAALFGALYAFTSVLIPYLYPNTTPEVQRLAQWGVLASALFQPVKASNMILFGILPAGGDTRYLLLSDFVTVALIGLPLAYLLAFPLEMGFVGIYLGRLLGEEISRVAMLGGRYFWGRWFDFGEKVS